MPVFAACRQNRPDIGPEPNQHDSDRRAMNAAQRVQMFGDLVGIHINHPDQGRMKATSPLFR